MFWIYRQNKTKTNNQKTSTKQEGNITNTIARVYQCRWISTSLTGAGMKAFKLTGCSEYYYLHDYYFFNSLSSSQPIDVALWSNVYVCHSRKWAKGVGTSGPHSAFHSPIVPCVWRHHNRKWSSGRGGLGLSNAPGGGEGEERISGLHCKSVCWSGTHAPSSRCAWTTPRCHIEPSNPDELSPVVFAPVKLIHLWWNGQWSSSTYSWTGSPVPSAGRGPWNCQKVSKYDFIYSFIYLRKIEEHTALYRSTSTRVNSGMIFIRLMPYCQNKLSLRSQKESTRKGNKIY